jgi:hypothetical protein
VGHSRPARPYSARPPRAPTLPPHKHLPAATVGVWPRFDGAAAMRGNTTAQRPRQGHLRRIVFGSARLRPTGRVPVPTPCAPFRWESGPPLPGRLFCWKRHMTWPVALRVGTGDFALAAGHRRIAISFVGGTMVPARSFRSWQLRIDRSERLLCHAPDRRRFLNALSDLHQVQKSTDEVAYERRRQSCRGRWREGHLPLSMAADSRAWRSSANLSPK